MKTILYISVLVLLIGGCSLFSSTAKTKNALVEATAQRWNTGARNGYKGVTFRVKFYALQEALKADTLWVNNIPLSVELTKVGDTAYVSSFFTAPQDEYKAQLITDTAYSGVLQFYVKNQKSALKISHFHIIPIAIYP